MKEDKKKETKNFLFAAGLFIIGIASLFYIAHALGTLLTGTVPAINAQTPYHSTKSDEQCQHGNLFSCAKEAFGLDQKK